jgi:alkylation response protein AidB-like acyl-CoA dehydrogenase/acyl carrier protein
MDERKCIPPYVVLDMGNRGLLGLQGPRELGGLALGHRDTLRVFEQLGALDQTLALFIGLHNVLGTRPIMRSATASTRNDLLPRLVSGRELAAFALTEPGAGSNPRAIRTRAVPAGPGRWRLHGTKFWSGIAAWAGVINVFAKLEDADGNALGPVAFAVRQGADGLRHGAEAPTMGMRAIVQNTVHLEGVEVGVEDMLGAPGDGLDVAQDAMMYGRLAIAAACIGGMRRCAQLMHRYADRRVIGGERLARNPITLERLEETTAAITGLDALVGALAAMLDEGRRIPDEVYAAVKILAPELCWETADRLVQMLGGRGYVETNVAPQILRDARVLRVFEGPTEAMIAYLGARLANDAGAVPEFVERELRSPEAAGRLRAALGRAPLHDDDLAVRARGRYRLGDIAAWAVLVGALEDRAGSAAHRWATRQLDARCQDVDVRAAAPDPDAIEREIVGYVDRIGDVEQTMVGEDTELDELLRRAAPDADEAPPAPEIVVHAATPPPTGANGARTAQEIEQFIVTWIGENLELRPDQIDRSAPFADLGADSVTAVELVMDLGRFVGRTLDETLPWEAPNIAAVAERLGAASAAPAPAAPGSVASDDDDELADIEISLRKLEERLGGTHGV